MNAETNLITFSSKSNALRALRRIVRNNDDLVEVQSDGKFGFDVVVAHAAADFETENDARGNEIVAPENKTPNDGGPKVTHTTEDTTMTKHYEEVTLDQLKAEEPAVDAAAEAEAKAAVKAAKDAEKQRKSDERAEAKRLKDAEKAELKSKKDAEKTASKALADATKAEAKAKRELEKAEKEASKGTSKSDADAQREARKAEREAARKSATEEKAAKVAAKLAEKDGKKAEREAKRQEKIDAAAAKKAEREAKRTEREANVVHGIRVPGEGSKVANCWAIIESLRDREANTFPTVKDYLAACEAQLDYQSGGTEVTRKTAYYDYRMYHRVTGRIVAPKEDAPAVDGDQTLVDGTDVPPAGDSAE